LIGFTSEGKPWLRCGGHVAKGKSKCYNNLVRQHQIVDCIIDSLKSEFLDPERVAQAREAYLKRLEEERDSVDVSAVKRARTGAEQRLENAKKRLLEVPTDLIDDVAEQVRGIKREIEEFDRQVEAAEVNVNAQAASFDDDVAVFGEMVENLAETVKDADPHTARAFLSSIIESVEVDISARKAGSKFRYNLEGGEILLKPGVSLPASW
jgi:hypothetical protein